MPKETSRNPGFILPPTHFGGPGPIGLLQRRHRGHSPAEAHCSGCLLEPPERRERRTKIENGHGLKKYLTRGNWGNCKVMFIWSITNMFEAFGLTIWFTFVSDDICMADVRWVVKKTIKLQKPMQHHLSLELPSLCVKVLFILRRIPIIKITLLEEARQMPEKIAWMKLCLSRPC